MYRSDFSALMARRRALETELALVRRDESDHRRRCLQLLERAYIATPCRQRWTRMVGDDRSRHCAHCDKKVYNLEALDAAEVEALLRQSGEVCARLYRRPDGTIVTADCAEMGRWAPDTARNTILGFIILLITAAATVAGLARQHTYGSVRLAPPPASEEPGGPADRAEGAETG
jgi:hypothetical protein